MDKIDGQFFETINGHEIRFSSFASTNTVEIRIENPAYVTARKQTIQHIFIVLFGCIFFNVFFHSHAFLIALNVVFFVTMATKCYTLANLIEFGKEYLWYRNSK